MTDGKEYGKALFMLTEECAATERVAEDVKVARTVFDNNPEYTKLLDSPALSKEERVALADKTFSALDENLLNLIKILTEARATHVFKKALRDLNLRVLLRFLPDMSARYLGMKKGKKEKR